MNAVDIYVAEHDGLTIFFRKTDMSLAFLPSNSALHENKTPIPIDRTQFVAAQYPQIGQVQRDALQSSLQDPRPALSRLTLTVSNVCNLNCGYCYAGGGALYGGSKFMSATTAMNALNWAARCYSRLDRVNFFGGEPTLNSEVIDLLCEYARYLYDHSVLSNLPQFGITTNGYSISDRMLETLIRNRFTANVSIDGPEEIHDCNRRTHSGHETYNQILANVRRMQSAELAVEFECTFTSAHQKLGFDIKTLMDFFHAEFGSRVLHCPIVTAAQGSEDFISLQDAMRLQSDAIAYSVANLANGVPSAISTAVRLLRSLISRIPIRHYCPAGTQQVTVNSDGTVFPCFMLMNRSALNLGNVNRKSTELRSDLPIHSWEKAFEIEVLRGCDKYQNPPCLECWAQPLCYGCLGEDHMRFGTEKSRSALKACSELCDYRRTLISSFFHAVASVAARPTGDA